MKFFDPIKKNKYLTFEDTRVTTTIRKDGKQKEGACQRDVLGLLVSTSYKTKQPVDIEKDMSYPLAPVPLSLCTADGAKRKTVKSKLYDASMNELAIISETLLQNSDLLQTYFLDLIAFIRTISIDSNKRTIRSVAWQVIKSIPYMYTKIYLVCDTYCEKSIKSGERVSRGQGKRYILKSPDMKIPSDFDDLLRNSENKHMLLNLIEQSLIEGKETLGAWKIYFSNINHCSIINSSQTELVPELTSDPEEADTKLVAFVQSTRVPPGHSIMIRSPSGDIDILLFYIDIDILVLFV